MNAARPSRPIELPQASAPAHPPPFRLPGEHFAASLLWLAVGSAGLVLVAPELARGNFLAPRVLAVTHAFTLGVITTTIFGALYQLFPVTMGVGARSVAAGHRTFWALQAGIGLLSTGFWFWLGWAQGLGWLVLAVAMGGLASNLIGQRRRATQGLAIGRYVSAGHAGLGTAMLVALARIGETLGWWHVDRLGVIATHFHLAAFGFATLTAVGIGSRMLPMFLVSHGTPEWPLRWIGPVSGAGLVLQAIGLLARLGPLVRIGGLLLAGGTVLYLGLALGYFRRRATAPLDPALGHVAAALAALALAVPLGIGLLAAPTMSPRGWAAYGLLGIGGWLVLLILGVYYRILPFLTWLNLFGGGAPGRPVPSAADLVRRSWAWTSLMLLATGLCGTTGAVLLGSSVWARAGAASYAVGVMLALAQVARALHLRSRRA
jgi:hypothetical protein